jgi:hypothetical protein
MTTSRHVTDEIRKTGTNAEGSSASVVFGGAPESGLRAIFKLTEIIVINGGFMGGRGSRGER